MLSAKTFKKSRLIAALLAGIAFGASAATSAAAEAPWRLADALNAPGWLGIDGTYRLRYETLDGTFRAKSAGSDQILVERLLFNVRADLGHFYLGAELEDSRAQLADAGSPLGTDDVDTFEPLRLYLGARYSGVLVRFDKIDVSAGRITIDAGSRRLVARNRFRNTLNGFTGIDGLWTGPGGSRIQAFFVLPVQREPTSRTELEDNTRQLDKESFKIQFWGVVASRPHLLGAAKGEVYLYGLHERDRPAVPAADRDIYTPGFRFFVEPAAKAWDFEIESALQFGSSRLTTSEGNTVRHFAGFFHGDVGYSWDANGSPRLELDYDYASGDENPEDGVNNRFDTLYGARRFDFGPTGIYGAFARSNINSPGLRIQAKLAEDVKGFVGYRAVWLASSRDTFTTANLRDATGNSGKFVGQQIEARLQYDVLRGNFALEAGGAYLFDGPFLSNVPSAPHSRDTAYFYTQATVKF